MKHIIKNDQRAFVYKNGSLKTILASGAHNFPSLFSAYEVDIQHINVSDTRFWGTESNILTSSYPELVTDFFYEFDIKDHEIGIVYRDGNLHGSLKGGQKHLYWRWFWEYTCETIDVKNNPEIDMKQYSSVKNLITAGEWLASYHMIHSHELAVLEINGTIDKVLKPGEYIFSTLHNKIQVESYDTRLQNLDVSGQEILTKDKISIRLNISVNFMIDDIKVFHSRFAEGYDYIYQKAQFIIRELASSKKLDELLESKNEVSNELEKLLTKALTDSGLKIHFVWIKDIILPWDMRDIMNQVIEAEKKSQINMIQRRDETATTRSLLNTAKLLEDNPLLLRLKELETLENVIDKVGNVNVSNGLDGLLKDFVKISK